MIFVVVLPFMAKSRKTRIVIKRKLLNKQNPGKRIRMQELAKNFIDHNCVIQTVNSGITQASQGIIIDVTREGIMLEDKTGAIEAISFDWVVSIKEKGPKPKRPAE
ncbi:MAG: hypothetical protein ATN33_07850 [Epulopiscium sp. Nele67-Bin001]|nr:MAG: hypothetical protein BEN18_10935 [Epulopiscium sp. Nuni2H_MBin001]OON92169.1 MAG: hypothetical protein ATN33_07850 [Epulopiscium sp. Nele67-Bin001]